MPSRGKAFGPTAASADTKTTIGAAYTMPRGGSIKFIRVTAYQGVTDKADTAILTLESDLQKGPWEFACAPASHEITVGGKVQTEVIPCDITVQKGEIITVSLTASEALEECVISIVWI